MSTLYDTVVWKIALNKANAENENVEDGNINLSIDMSAEVFNRAPYLIIKDINYLMPWARDMVAFGEFKQPTTRPFITL